MSRKTGGKFPSDYIELNVGRRFVTAKGTDAGAVPGPVFRALPFEPGFGPRLHPFRTKFFERGHRSLFANTYFSLCKRRSVRCFHLSRYLVVALLGRLANELPLPHEFVPIHAAGTTLPTLAACFIHPVTVTPSFVDHGFSFFSPPLGLAPFRIRLLRVAFQCVPARSL